MTGPVIAVAWQSRFVDGKWSECSREHVEWVRSVPHEWPGYEVRELYTAPQPAPAIDLEQFRHFINACGHGAGTFPERKAEAARLLALIDGQKAAPRGPDQPDLCDLCRTREEVRSDAEGIPFCQECWDGWQSEEAKQQPTKGEGE